VIVVRIVGDYELGHVTNRWPPIDQCLAQQFTNPRRPIESALDSDNLSRARRMAHVVLMHARMSAPQYASARNDRSVATTVRAHRQLDGVPHDVVGLSALFSVLFAAVVLGMWLSGSTGRIAAVAICMIGVPMLVSNLRARSERERADEEDEADRR